MRPQDFTRLGGKLILPAGSPGPDNALLDSVHVGLLLTRIKAGVGLRGWMASTRLGGGGGQ